MLILGASTSKLKPKDGGWEDPGEFDMSQILHPWAPRKCQIPTPGCRFLPKTGLSNVKFLTPGYRFLPKTGLSNVKFPTPG